MIKKTCSAIVFSSLMLNAHAENGAKTFLECQTTQISGSTNRWDIVDGTSFVKTTATVFNVVVLDDEVWVDSTQFKQKDTPDEPNVKRYSLLSVTPYLYDGVNAFESGLTAFDTKSNVGIANYVARHERVRLGRVGGEFHFNETFYVSDIPDSQWKNINTGNLRYGFIDRTFDGSCKKTSKKSIF